MRSLHWTAYVRLALCSPGLAGYGAAFWQRDSWSITTPSVSQDAHHRSKSVDDEIL